MDGEDILNGLLRGALGGRRKRSRGARRMLGASGGLIMAAGLAWGAYEAWKGQKDGSRPTPPPGGGVPPVPGRAGGDTLPPVPEASPTPALPDPVLRLVRLMVSAARADGELGAEERERILEEARRSGAEEMVARELDSPVPLAEIVGDVTDPALKEQLYTLAFSVVRADESVTGGERVYLVGLAHQMGLAPETVSRLETEAAAAIDAAAREADASEE